MSPANCVFCKIAAGQIPALKVLEDDDCVAFLDVSPLAPGHTLLVPRQHVTDLSDVTAEQFSTIARHFPRLAAAILKATGAGGMNLLQNTGAPSGQAVFHLHFHFIPRRDGDKLGFRWNAGKYAAGEAEQMQGRLLAAL